MKVTKKMIKKEGKKILYMKKLDEGEERKKNDGKRDDIRFFLNLSR